EDARFMYVKKAWLAPGGGHLIFHARQQTDKVVRIGLETAVRQSTVETGFLNLAQVEQVEQLAQDLLVTPRSAPLGTPVARSVPPPLPVQGAAPYPAQGPAANLVPQALPPALPRTLPAAWQATVDHALGANEVVLWAGQPDRAMSLLHSLLFPAGCLVVT